MAVTIVATVGGASANSYCTLAEATTYHEGHPYGEVWLDYSDDQRNRALVLAAQLLEEYVEWEGWRLDEYQALSWPRIGTYTRDRRFAISTTVVPSDVKNAQAELARLLLASDRTEEVDIPQGITQLSVEGAVSLTFDKLANRISVVPDSVWVKIQHLGTLRSARSINVPLARG